MLPENKKRIFCGSQNADLHYDGLENMNCSKHGNSIRGSKKHDCHMKNRKAGNACNQKKRRMP